MQSRAVILLVGIFLQATVPAYTAPEKNPFEELRLIIYSMGIGDVMAIFRFNMLPSRKLGIFVEQPLNLTSIKGMIFGIKFHRSKMRACRPRGAPDSSVQPLFWGHHERLHNNLDFVREVVGDIGSYSAYGSIAESCIVLFSTKKESYRWSETDYNTGVTYLPIGCGIITSSAGNNEKFRKEIFEPADPSGALKMTLVVKAKIIFGCLVLIGMLSTIKDKK